MAKWNMSLMHKVQVLGDKVMDSLLIFWAYACSSTRPDETQVDIWAAAAAHT